MPTNILDMQSGPELDQLVTQALGGGNPRPYSSNLLLATEEVAERAEARGPQNIWLSYDAHLEWDRRYKRIKKTKMTDEEMATEICKAFLLAKEQDAHHTSGQR